MVDLIVVNYNTKHFMDMVIDSIYKWTPLDTFRLFVVDNGSTDGSYEYLQEKQKVYTFELIKLEKNLGVGPAYNHVIKVGIKQGNDVVLIHSDIEIRSPWIEDVMKLCQGNKGMVEVRVNCANGVSQFGGTAFVLLSREMLSEIGLFSTEFFQAEDEDFRVRIHAAGWCTAFCKTADIFHIQGGTLQQVLKDGEKGSPLINEAADKFRNKYTSKYLEEHHHITVSARNSEPLN